MQRRKFLVGMGSLAAGTTAVIGSGATNIEANDRKASVNVVSDNPSGVLGFEDPSPGDIVNLTDGEIEIDFAEASGADGANVGGTFVIGNLQNGARIDGEEATGKDYSSFTGIGDAGVVDSDGTRAFNLINQSTMDLHITLTYEPNNGFTAKPDGSVLAFYYTHGAESEHQELVIANPNDTADYDPSSGNFVDGTAESSDPPVAPGEQLRWAVALDTNNPNSSTEEDLSGTLTISGEPPSNI